jgi:hypothetical protein
MTIYFNNTPSLRLNTFQSYLNSKDFWSKPLLHNFLAQCPFEHGITTSDEIIICSDGGLQGNSASCGVALSINDKIIANTTVNLPLPFEYSTFSSYRSEAYGLLSALVMYEQLQEYTTKKFGILTQTTIIIYCDNKSLINKVNSVPFRKLNTKFHYRNDSDIIREIIQLLKKLGQLYGFIRIRHIKGHQDRTSSSLNKEALLNIEADRLATSAQLQPPKQPLQLPNTTAILQIQDKNVASRHTIHIREAHSSIKLREHYINVNSWTADIYMTMYGGPHMGKLCTSCQSAN